MAMTPTDKRNLEKLRKVLRAEGKVVSHVKDGFTVINEDGNIIARMASVELLCKHYQDAFSRYDQEMMGIHKVTVTPTPTELAPEVISAPSLQLAPVNLLSVIQPLSEDDMVDVLEALHMNAEDAPNKNVRAVFGMLGVVLTSAHKRMALRNNTRASIRAQLRSGVDGKPKTQSQTNSVMPPPVVVLDAKKVGPKQPGKVNNIKRFFRKNDKTLRDNVLIFFQNQQLPLTSDEVATSPVFKDYKASSVKTILNGLVRKGLVRKLGSVGNHTYKVP